MEITIEREKTAPAVTQLQRQVSSGLQTKLAPKLLQTETQKQTKRVRIELSNMQDMLTQVHEDFRVKEEARLAVVRETEELEAELKEVQRQTEEQAMQSGSAGASADEYGRKLALYTTKLAALREAADQLSATKIDDLRSEWARVEEIDAMLETDFASLSLYVTHLRRNLREADEQVQAAKLACAQLGQKVDRQAEELARKRAETEAIDKEIDATHALTAAAESANALAEEEIAARSVAIEVTTASIAELETLKAERAAELHTEQLRLEECRASCVEEKAGLLAAIGEIKLETSAAENQTREFEGESLMLDKKQNSLVSRNETLRDKVARLESSMSEQAAEEAELSSAQEVLRSEIETLKLSLEELTQEVAEKTAEVAAAEQMRDREESDKQQRESRLRELSKEDIALTRQLLQLSSTLERETKAAQRAVDAAAEESSSLAREIEEMERAHALGLQEEEALREKVARHEQAKVEMEDRRSKAEEETAQLDLKLAEEVQKHSLIQQQAQELVALEDSNRDARQTLAERQMELDALQSAHKALLEEAEYSPMPEDEEIVERDFNEALESRGGEQREAFRLELAAKHKSNLQITEKFKTSIAKAKTDSEAKLTEMRSRLSLVQAELERAREQGKKKEEALPKPKKPKTSLDILHEVSFKKDGYTEQLEKTDSKKAKVSKVQAVEQPIAATPSAGKIQSKIPKPAFTTPAGRAKTTKVVTDYKSSKASTGKAAGSDAGSDSWLFDGW